MILAPLSTLPHLQHAAVQLLGSKGLGANLRGDFAGADQSPLEKLELVNEFDHSPIASQFEFFPNLPDEAECPVALSPEIYS